MSHARTAIRTQAAAILTGLPTTASRVYTSQVYPLTVVPALRIYTGDDAMRGQQVISRAYEDRAVQLVIECHVKQTTDLEDTLDTMAGEIEQALANNRKLNDTAKDCFFSGSRNNKTIQ